MLLTTVVKKVPLTALQRQIYLALLSWVPSVCLALPTWTPPRDFSGTQYPPFIASQRRGGTSLYKVVAAIQLSPSSLLPFEEVFQLLSSGHLEVTSNSCLPPWSLD